MIIQEHCASCGLDVANPRSRDKEGKALCEFCAVRAPFRAISAFDTVRGLESVQLKARRPGEKPYLRLKTGASLEKITGLWRDRFMRVDRPGDRYDEVIRSLPTRAILHECHERLSAHRGHGSAKPRQGP